MPIARFQMDDGRVARFEVPEGTTPEQAQAMMAARIASPLDEGEMMSRPPVGVKRKAAPATNDIPSSNLQLGPLDTGIPLPPSFDRALAGAGARALDIATLGMRDRTAADAILKQSPEGRTGAALTDLATLGLGAAKLPGAIARATGLPMPLANMASAAAYEGATRPGSATERARNALEGAGAALGGDMAVRAVSRGLGGPLRASNVTPEAQGLMKEGVFVPPWKATDNQMVRDLAERAKVGVFTRPVVTGAEKRAFEDYNRTMIAKSQPPMPVMDEAGNILRWEKAPKIPAGDGSVNALKNQFNDAYDAIYKNRRIPLDKDFGDTLQAISAETRNYYPSEAEAVDGIIRKVRDTLSSVESKTTQSPILNAFGNPISKTEQGRLGVSNDNLKQALDVVESAIDNAWKTPGGAQRAEQLMGIRDTLNAARIKGLPPEVQSQVADVNRAYTNFLQYQRAMSNLAAQKQGMVTPGQVLSAQKALGGREAFARGNVPGQQSAVNAERVLGSRLPEVGPGTAEKMFVSSPLAWSADAVSALSAEALLNPLTRKYIFGQYGFQTPAYNLLQRQIPVAAQATRGLLSED